MPIGVYSHKPNQGFQKGNKIWKGRVHSEETKEKLRKPKGKLSHFKGKTYKEIYGKDWKKQAETRRLSKIAHHDRVGRNAIFRRPAHDTWVYRNFTKKVFERDNYTCRLCGKKVRHLHADHYPRSFAEIVVEKGIRNMQEAIDCKELWDINNGRTLCVPCHKKTDTYGRKVGEKKVQAEKEKLSHV